MFKYVNLEKGGESMKNVACGNRDVVVNEFSETNSYSPEQFLTYVNCLIEDPDAVVSFKEKKTMEDEYNWIKNVLHAISSQKMTMLVAQWKNQIIGAAAVSLLPERRDHVAELGISIIKDFRGYGLGTHLLQGIIVCSKEKIKPAPLQIRVSTFGSNSGGIRFYQSHGFREVARIPGQFQDDNQYVDEVILLYSIKN